MTPSISAALMRLAPSAQNLDPAKVIPRGPRGVGGFVALLVVGVLTAVPVVARAGEEEKILDPCEDTETGIEQIAQTEADSSGWSRQIREFAVEIWPYAQLASNVYMTEKRFEMSSWRALGKPLVNDDLGFYAQLYRRTNDGELALVFRGTDGFTDWWNGNVTNKQNAHGLRVFTDVRKANPGKHITLVGHSLGGAIAMYISLRTPNVTVYAFNGSPKFSAPEDQCFANERHSIVERAEILKLLRLFARGATQTYTSIGCQRGLWTRFRLIFKHGMRELAECVTEIAAIESADARASMSANDLKAGSE